jgi:hypothetical protein
LFRRILKTGKPGTLSAKPVSVPRFSQSGNVGTSSKPLQSHELQKYIKARIKKLSLLKWMSIGKMPPISQISRFVKFVAIPGLR